MTAPRAIDEEDAARARALGWHPSLTYDRIIEACHRRIGSTDNPGLCTCCGVDVDGIEPDARAYECETCGEPAVFGCEELLFEVSLGAPDC